MPFCALGKPFEVRAILAVHQGALGDFILALPVLEVLRETFSKAKLVILGYPRILELVKNRFYAEEVLSVDQRGMATFFAREGPLDPALSQFLGGVDLIIVFGKDRNGPLLTNLRRVCQGQVLHIHSFPPPGGRIHLTDHLMSEMSRHGFAVSGRAPRLFLNESDRVWAEDFWRKEGLSSEDRSRMAILHPGSGSKKKIWPPERFAELVEHLQKPPGSRTLVVVGPAEGKEIRDTFERMKDPGPIVAAGLPLVRLASIMEGGRLFIGNDSGISHLAAALGLPTLAIFGPTDPEVWSPRGEKVWVVRKEIPCSPCSGERLFQCKHFECLRTIGVEDVLERLRKMEADVYSMGVLSRSL